MTFGQAFHVCALGDMDGGLLTYSFLCPNGTIFNQQIFTCVWWMDFDCDEAAGFYREVQLDFTPKLEYICYAV